MPPDKSERAFFDGLLAQDLLRKGPSDMVIEYFQLCRKFWKMDTGRLDQWSQEAKAGKIPDFGANLVY